MVLFVSGLLVLLLVLALLIIRPGSAAKASGGGGCFGGTPTVYIFPTTSSPGTFINVSGSCYPANTTVKVLFTFTRPSLSVFGDGYNGSQFSFGSMVIVNGSGWRSDIPGRFNNIT